MNRDGRLTSIPTPNDQFKKSTYLRIQYLNSLHISLQVIARSNRPDPRRCAGKYQVSNIQRKKFRYIGNDLVNGEDHIPCVSILHPLFIFLQLEGYVSPIRFLSYGNKTPYGRRSVKSFCYLPWQSFFLLLALH